jgi:hypothetical protein
MQHCGDSAGALATAALGPDAASSGRGVQAGALGQGDSWSAFVAPLLAGAERGFRESGLLVDSLAADEVIMPR